MVKGIDEEEFDYLNQILENPVDKAAFLAGEECILYYPGFQVPDGYVGEKNITFSVREGRLQFLLPRSAMSGIMEEREISDQILL